MSIGKIMGKIVKMLPKTEGAAGRITLGRAQLTQIAQQDQKAARVINKALEKTTNPKLDIAYKAESNYAIAGMRLRDGKKVIGQGAVSITNPGSSQAVVKYRASANGGSTLQANGFLDGGKVADGKDMAVSLSRKGGKVKSDLEIGQATRHHIEFDEQQAVDLAKEFDAKDILQDYAEATNKLQRTLDGAMVDIRQGLRGEVQRATSTTPLKECKPLNVSKVAKESAEIFQKSQKLKINFNNKIPKKKLAPRYVNADNKIKTTSKVSKESAETFQKNSKTENKF